MNNLWWCNISHLHDLVEEDINITISMNGVCYNNDYDHEYDDAIPSLLVFKPQKFIWIPSNTIDILGLMTRKSQGVDEMIKYPLLFTSIYLGL